MLYHIKICEYSLVAKKILRLSAYPHHSHYLFSRASQTVPLELPCQTKLENARLAKTKKKNAFTSRMAPEWGVECVSLYIYATSMRTQDDK